MKLDKETEQIKKALGKKSKAKKLTEQDFLPTGSTLMDIAISGKPGWGYPKGKLILYVGGSGSGKTLQAHQSLAEACKAEHFQDYLLFYDNGEDGALMSLEKFWPILVGRVKPPKRDKSKNPVYSTTVDEFYDNVENALNNKDGKPIVYVQDSFDVLDTGENEEKDKMGMLKAKQNKRRLRKIVAKLSRTGSILIIICHAMPNANIMEAKWKPETRSGGTALTFFATVEIWFSSKAKIKKKVLKKWRSIGQNINVKIVKNRIEGRDWEIALPILYQHGIDDTGSMVDFLVSEGHWAAKYNKQEKREEPTISAPEFEFEGKREKLIQKIEELDAEKELRDLVIETWREIENGCQVKRKPRYQA